MRGQPWSDLENDLIVADYFVMLAAEIAGKRLNKSEHRRALMPLLSERNDGSIDFKHSNISAVMKGLGEVYIQGYKPAFNYQASLEDAVERWLDANPDWFDRSYSAPTAISLSDEAQIWIGPAPTLSNQPDPAELGEMLRVARKFNVAERDERNRALGRAGEQRVLHHERTSLTVAGRPDLASKVRWAAEEDGDGLGYDIASFEPDGRPRLLEVKTTNGWERTPFYLSQNEVDVSNERRAEWCLFRLWNFSSEPKAFELRPPLDAHVKLTAKSYQASFH